MNGRDGRLAMAKKKAEPMCDGGKRKWLTTETKSYGNDSQSTIVHVLEGSPPRAFIIEQPSRGFATLIDMEGRFVGTAVNGDYGPVSWRTKVQRT